jgi:hypothetical protein
MCVSLCVYCYAGMRLKVLSFIALKDNAPFIHTDPPTHTYTHSHTYTHTHAHTSSGAHVMVHLPEERPTTLIKANKQVLY